MTQMSKNKMVSIWLFIVCILISIMVVFGGYVRLTRSGLSMVEWHVVTGVIPPLTEADWQETFDKYRQSPEYIKINKGMSLDEYKFIYYMEYFHRVLGRLTGLVLVIPMVIFFILSIIPKRQIPIYVAIAILFAMQGFMGWYMVSSGLVDKPHVSHFRLTAHLFFALLLLGLCFWVALSTLRNASSNKPSANDANILTLFGGLMAILLIQVAYGGFVAGLKAGHVSNTFPLMGGYLIPPALISSLDDLFSSSMAVHFIHRWFAFAVLAGAIGLYYVVKKKNCAKIVQSTALGLVIAICVQIVLGIGVVIFNVPISLALIHQGFALVLFLGILFVMHRLRYA